ncbi:helix-turn-helix transcriptional regulator [Desulfobotulus sp.]|uniref:helix-turn-helix domain-containing protein n=1 Tax=Desulfobotulus sp. TaxID=1940337 RepID=UPI002A3669AE|nr:helix-turn-helix transcriptional regulator [Desulfobotulus sp.]MDY0164421.1 helix-turn-helix transcriptional regulator [Desulfobotulus sp.]
MKTKYCKENDQIATGHFHRSFSGEEKDLSGRLSECLDGEPVAAFARRAGIGESTLRNILKGASPRADHLAAIAFAAGVTLDWLATGQGIKSAVELRRLTRDRCAATPDVAPLNFQLLQSIISGVEEGLQMLNKDLEPDKKAQLVALLYEHFQKSGNETDSGTVLKYLKLVA